LDDKGVPNQKYHTNDSGKDMDMSYIKVTKKKQEGGRGSHFGKPNETNQTK
jgi:hypothetical protein